MKQWISKLEIYIFSLEIRMGELLFRKTCHCCYVVMCAQMRDCTEASSCPKNYFLNDAASLSYLSMKCMLEDRKLIYFIVSGEISVYLVKIKVVSITSELISYHFTCD